MIEMIVSMALLAILVEVFATTFTTTVNINAEVRDQNLAQVEVRAGLNRVVNDLRDATYGNATATPIAAKSATSVTLYSPDRMQPAHMRQITYSVNGTTFQRQETVSTNTNGPPWTWGATTTQTLFDRLQNPTSVFTYCTQTPTTDLHVSTTSNSDPITWTCTPPSTLADIKTVIVNAKVATTGSPTRVYSYESVATLRASPQ